MAPEPSHLVSIAKNCLRCDSTDVKFMYFNNRNESQPRYKCHGCGQFFTYGGRIRPRRARARPPQTRTASTAVVAAAAADRRTGPVRRRGRPRGSSQRATPQSGAREVQETPAATAGATGARTEAARTVATSARTELARTVAAAGTMARPTTGALGLPRRPRKSPVESPVVSSVESPAVRGPISTARIAGVLVPTGDVVVDVDQRPANRTAAAKVIGEGGDANENRTMRAVLGVPPYGLAPAPEPANNVKRLKKMRIKYDGKESVLQFWA